jgi:hypothetical protein
MYEKYETHKKSIKANMAEKYQKNRLFGYCMAAHCKSIFTPKHAAPFGSNVGYHCIDCLSALLVDLREKSFGAIIKMKFGDGEDSNDKIVIKFGINNDVWIDNSIGSYPFEWIESASGPLIQIMDKCIIDGVEKKGTCFAQIKGRQVCENIILGKTCYSFNEHVKISNFMIESVPSGVCGWVENQTDSIGKVTVHRFCPKCAYQSEQNKMTWRVIKNPENSEEYWKIKYSKLMREFSDLRIKYMELEAQFINLEYSQRKT